MFQVFAWFTSRGDISRVCKQYVKLAYDIVVDTLTRFSHSNSVHMARNYNSEKHTVRVLKLNAE